MSEVLSSESIVCVLCGSTEAKWVTSLRSITFEWAKVSKVQVVLSAPIQSVRCPKCDRGADGTVSASALEEWEKLICAQIIGLSNPPPSVHAFVRKTYGMNKQTCRWLALWIDKMEGGEG